MGKIVNKIFLLLVFVAMSANVCAQSAADKLFNEGIKLQKTRTEASQNAAIKKFKAAKISYDSAAKKKSCDTQISKCNKIIEELKPTPKVKLSLSTSRVEFKSRPRRGQEVEVYCNFKDWTIVSYPKWIHGTIYENYIYVEADRNDGDPRTGKIVIQCKSKKVTLEVFQDRFKTIFE